MRTDILVLNALHTLLQQRVGHTKHRCKDGNSPTKRVVEIFKWYHLHPSFLQPLQQQLQQQHFFPVCELGIFS